MDTPPLQKESPAPKPSPLLVIGTLLLVVINTTLGYAMAIRRTGNMAYSMGSATASIVMPIVIMLLFSLSPGFRNNRSRTKVIFWTSLVILLSTFGRLGRQ